MDLGHPQRPPPSYNQAVALHPPGARTVSGSDTDVSTSAENLTHEEKYVLSHTERQDPQGEENLVKTALTGADFATPAGAMEWVKSVEKALKRPMGPPTGRPPPQYPRPGSAAAAAAVAATGQMPYSSLERLLGQRDGTGPAQVNGKETKPAAMGSGVTGTGGGGTMSDKSNSSSSSQLAPAEGSSTGYDAGGAASARADKSPLSRSQPDLNRNGAGDPLRPPAGQYREPPDYVAANAHEMMQILMLENSSLKQEIDMCQRKVAKLQKFARELEKLQSDYDDLVRTCQRREQLEYIARQKLTSEVRRATDLNNSLSSQLDTSKLDEDKKQTDRREVLIKQLVAQNKDLQAVKERQEIELTAQRATLQEQRQYIDILDTALSKAQENVVRVEKEHSERLQTQYVDRNTFVERVTQLQRALTSCHLAADRREAAHKKIRADLEREIAELKSAVAGKQGDDNGNSRQEELADLRQKLRDANERILMLETELAHCQQKFVDNTRESELMMERSLPPRLEPTPPPTHQLHQLTGSQSHASMEERVLGLEARLVEKDAMIRALQKHALEVPALMRNPHSRQSSLQSLAGMNSREGGNQPR
ncbi:Angiomotin [Amphibalanus amphitrite]|uniref:Angiomotin n=1 Tax=Amphibalanus amphitrite TaxID=1232801 RepID=A0A6A4VIH9_AMPAM|nr:Angiomotin [Amphibalanus amphitrite]